MRAGRPFPAMTLSDVPRKPCARAFAPSWAWTDCLPEVITPRVLTVVHPRYLWCRRISL